MGLHLWFVLTDPDPNSGLVVMVALVSERSHTEKTVSLGAGDHPFIGHASNVAYGTATFAPSAKLNERIARGAAVLKSDMSGALLDNVRQGIFRSSYAPNDVVDYCRSLFGAEGEAEEPR